MEDCAQLWNQAAGQWQQSPRWGTDVGLDPRRTFSRDYVIVHELLYLRYRDHGKQFKAMMTALVPWRDLEGESRHSSRRQTGTD
jgi:hypothetical protein